MNKERILIVEDDSDWVDNYKRWLDDEYIIDDTPSSEKALELLKTKYYALVLLDLSLNPTSIDDRASEMVQEFLKGNPEATKHIVISGHAGIDDVHKAALKYKAFNVFFKAKHFNDLDPFLESVKNAIAESRKDRPNFNKEAYEVFCGVGERNIIEYNIKQLLNPEQGINGWVHYKDKFMDCIAPIFPHRTRSKIVFENKCILGLFWSRKIGKAISVCLAHTTVSEDECVQTLNNWLGWPHKDGKEISGNNIRGYYFVEPDLSPEDFALPKKN